MSRFVLPARLQQLVGGSLVFCFLQGSFADDLEQVLWDVQAHRIKAQKFGGKFRTLLACFGVSSEFFQSEGPDSLKEQSRLKFSVSLGIFIESISLENFNLDLRMSHRNRKGLGGWLA